MIVIYEFAKEYITDQNASGRYVGKFHQVEDSEMKPICVTTGVFVWSVNKRFKTKKISCN